MKVLVVRFSSIGDIVLCTPVIRALKLQLEAEVHFLCRSVFKSVVEDNPYVDKLWSFQEDFDELVGQLKNQDYDWIIDLHHNLRSLRLKQSLGVPAQSFPKLNIEKWLFVNFKWNRLPQKHIVDRYMETVETFDLKYDGKGLDFFINSANQIQEVDGLNLDHDYMVLVLGAAHMTKQIPSDKLEELLIQADLPVVLVGGPDEAEEANCLKRKFGKKVFHECGGLNIQQSAWIIKRCKFIVTPDTGMMHIAAAFEKPMITVWGNTVPEFGMTPFYSQNGGLELRLEQKMKCRPCSKIGYKECPKGHFKCMVNHDLAGALTKFKLELSKKTNH